MFFALYLILDFLQCVFSYAFIHQIEKTKTQRRPELEGVGGGAKKERGGVATKIKETKNRMRAERKQTEKKTKKVCDFSAYNFILQIWHFCFIFSCFALLYDNSIFPFLNLNN
jgi:hypothetical protein